MFGPTVNDATGWTRLPKVPPRLKEQLALCNAHPEKVLFLDIETTGLSHHYDEITVIGWSFEGRANTIVKGQSPDQLLQDAQSALVLVTFNGIRFDQRFLQRELPDISLPAVHIDLMYLCRRVGLTGGQKAIEKRLGLNFRDDIADVDGWAAVLLWHRYLRGDQGALKTLVRYNRADIAAMGAIFDRTLELLWIDPDFFSAPAQLLQWAAPPGWHEIPSLHVSAKQASAPGFTKLLGNKVGSHARVVGIDLTGSERRGTGWCLLEGRAAKTKTLFTDEDILNHTLECEPDLVSIDSPLCLPVGRTSVDDSDPGRESYGIMRECERELKRRGVNVYPCLLPSMQKLTARGIRLANKLRGMGVPVIESYPGAAQDIMRIPRKGAGVEWLKLGLHEFEIEGEYIKEKVSHDELDAITSALVGTFHMTGLSESLGTEDEPPLIIPKLDAEKGPVVVGVSGPIAAGKTTFAEALEHQGFAYTRFSLVIDELLKEQDEQLDRANRQRLGADLHRAGRQRWLAEQTLKRVAGERKIVVDGLRFPEDHAFLVETFGARFRHVFVEADANLREERYQGRSGDGNFAEADSSEVEERVGELRILAHEIVDNNSTMAALRERAKAIAMAFDEGDKDAGFDRSRRPIRL